ncbi:MAG: cytidine deaminase [Clostridium sp.]|jgi:cytidine deaminase|nr:cytidine deaminase [Clostridium sp.]
MTKQQELVQAALAARDHAHAPYSNFYVGAALLTRSGKIFTGCNMENASFGATICAERVAMGSAIAAGERDFEMIAIAGALKDARTFSPAYPCGLCTQVMSEFVSPQFGVLLVKGDMDLAEYVEFSFKDLMPHTFKLAD